MDVGWLHYIPLLPLLGAAFCGLAGKWVPKAWVYAAALVTVLLSFLVGLVAFEMVSSSPAPTAQVRELVFNWMAAGKLSVDLGLAVDRLSGAMVLVVTGVGFLIHVYSVGYMDEDPGYWRFFAYLNLFVAAMLLLVLADNLVAMFVGWEGVGLCSYLLIGFWFDDEAKATAGRKAFIVNRIGDFGFLLGIFALFAFTGHVDYTGLRGANLSLAQASIACALLFVGAIGKSAQLPLYVWLPDAMAGPTPVSALIHAATMVTAGVYMVARLSFLYIQAPGVLCAIALVGALTAAWAALIATSQTDIKKVLAYSTVSQLGFMFMGVGVGAFFAGTMHLVTHAFFKACLFLGAGAVIHGLHGEQEMTKMGGLRRHMPRTALTFLVATVAITGLIPLSGFFSKDEILAQALHTNAFSFLRLPREDGPIGLTWLGPAIYLLGTATALLTSFYMWRCYLLTFEGSYRGPSAVTPHESPPIMTAPLQILAALSVVGLVLGLPEGFAHKLHLEGFTWEHFTKGFFAVARGGPPGQGNLLVTYLVALAVAWAGAFVAWRLYGPEAAGRAERLAAQWPRLRAALVNKFYVDELYDRAIVRPLWALARGAFTVVDKTLIDNVLVNGSAQLVAGIGSLARRFQNGDVQRYAALTAVGLLVLVWALLKRGAP